MYLRQFAYTIAPGREEKAVALCERFVDALRARGIRARVLIGGKMDATLQVVEEYGSRADMATARTALEHDDAYRRAVSAWALEFYPLVRAAAPAIILHDQQAA